MKTYLITGINRGLGFAYTRQLLAEGHNVFGTARAASDKTALQELTARYPEQLKLYINELASAEDARELARALAADTDKLDVLINNAGMLTDGETIQTLNSKDLTQNYHVNTVMPVMLVQALLPLLNSGIIVNISSSFASIGLKNGDMPPRYSYAMSKAALNMFTKTLALELVAESTIVVAIHPGWVRTDLGGPDARFSPEESAEAVLTTISQLTPDQSGMYLTWHGREIQW
ncbi:MAG: SDR family oxidoreductase [Deinococcota bacterium]